MLSWGRGEEVYTEHPSNYIWWEADTVPFALTTLATASDVEDKLFSYEIIYQDCSDDY